MKKTVISEAIAAVFILLFVYTAINKIVDTGKFYHTLYKSPLLENWASTLVWFIPFSELVIAALLFIPLTRRGGLIAASGLMLAFTIYIGYMLLLADKLPCSCGGILSQLSWGQHFVFNIILLLLGLIGITTNRNKQMSSPYIQSVT